MPDYYAVYQLTAPDDSLELTHELLQVDQPPPWPLDDIKAAETRIATTAGAGHEASLISLTSLDDDFDVRVEFTVGVQLYDPYRPPVFKIVHLTGLLPHNLIDIANLEDQLSAQLNAEADLLYIRRPENIRHIRRSRLTKYYVSFIKCFGDGAWEVDTATVMADHRLTPSEAPSVLRQLLLLSAHASEDCITNWIELAR